MSEVNFKSGNRYIDEPDLMLLEFKEQGSSFVHRAVRNNEPIVARGETYEPSNISVTIPNSGDAVQQTNISLPNSSRIPGQAVLQARRPIEVRLINSLGGDYDTFLQDTEDMFLLRDVTVDSSTVGGTLTPKADVQISVPFSRTGKEEFPGLWM